MFNLFKSRINPSLPLGKRGELLAQKIYCKQGYKILAANEFNRTGKQAGEVDFIAADKKTIVFVEVKTRTAPVTKHGTGAESVHYYKQQRLLKAVKLFLARNPGYRNLQPKIDVCLIIMGNLDKEPRNVTIISNAVDDTN